MAAPPFVPGVALARGFFREHVEPVISAAAPNLSYSAGIVGPGSEVLEFDTVRSTDHHWGPRVMLFVETGQRALIRDVSRALAEALPHSYRGYPTGFTNPDTNDAGVQLMTAAKDGPVNHRCEFFEFDAWLEAQLGVPVGPSPTFEEWIGLPTQRLAEVTGGELFRDDLAMEKTREKLSWYPQDVWLYLMAGHWMRIAQEEHLTGRAAEVGDDLGSRLIASRLVRDIMRLGFLMDRVYAPYAKWLGSAFERLPCAERLRDPLRGAVAASTWKARERALMTALENLAEHHTRLEVTASRAPTARRFHGRP